MRSYVTYHKNIALIMLLKYAYNIKNEGGAKITMVKKSP